MTTTPSDAPWSIAVRTVGGSNAGRDEQDDFTVTVSPDDDLACLHHKIQDRTGLKASQQRLIYRGRLISGGVAHVESEKNEPKVRDVVGLCDGQTIHLVPKPDEEVEEDTSADSNSREGQSASDESGSTSSGGGGATSLLAALLGLGSSADEEDTSDGATPLLRRSTRRRPNYRLTEADHVVPDPGSLEPVRQGLMTLHTMLGAHGPTDQPWEANRQFYRGQWLDCRDTVNQWLEATVVDIVRAEDVLSERRPPRSRRRPTQPADDEAVSANDFEGRRQLLLEPDGDNGLCERQTNDGVQLLLIHYNGWPHRWDEWIRSDSERIRPFRSRTRHSLASGTLPTPQSVFDAAPSTNIKEETDEDDRAALLPEVSRTVSSVSRIIEDVVSGSIPEGTSPEAQRRDNDLPWLSDADDFPSAWPENAHNRTITPHYSRRQLQALAPLLDRLGRCLTEAAPHVASLASNLPEDEQPPPESRPDPEVNNVIIVGEEAEELPPLEERSSISTGGGLFSLLSRESRGRNHAASHHVGSSHFSLNSDDAVGTPVRDEPDETLDADYFDFVNGPVNTTRGESRGGRRGSSLDDAAGLLGAYLALSSLVSDDTSDNNDNGGGGLQGVGRLLRDRGNNGGGGGGGGGGIDIHIHAIVTAPGVAPPGPAAMAMMGGPPPPANTGGLPRALFAGVGRRGGGTNDSTRTATAPTNGVEDDMGIFADLYSENPTPLDPHGTPPLATEVAAGSDDEEGTENTAAELISNSVTQARTRSEREARSPRRRRSFHSERSSRRSNTIGRALRNAFSPRRRSSANDSDSE